MKYLRTLRPVVQRLLLAMFACVVTSQWVAAQEAELRFTIKGGNKSALPIAVVPFASAGDSGSVDIAAVIRSDLERSGQFNPMPPADMPSRPTSFTEVNFKDWRVLGQENLVLGKVVPNGDGNLDGSGLVIAILRYGCHFFRCSTRRTLAVRGRANRHFTFAG